MLEVAAKEETPPVPEQAMQDSGKSPIIPNNPCVDLWL